jgi:hypothetical protein
MYGVCLKQLFIEQWNHSRTPLKNKVWITFNFLKMKKIILLGLASMLMFLISNTHAQVAEGDCDLVKVISTPYYPIVYFTSVGYTNCNDTGGSYSGCEQDGRPACCRIISSGTPTTPRYWLEQYSYGSWITIAGPQFSTVFSNLSPGNYRVRMQLPRVDEYACGPTGNPVRARMCLFNILGQYIGLWGEWGDVHYTNEVFVGPAQSSDIQWEYLDGDGLDLGANLFDFGEEVRINTSGTQNYTHWWLAIFELNGAQRYKAAGWNSGAMPQIISLTSFWEPWIFENLHSYRVQLAISNGCNTQWVEMSPQAPDFFICPAGSGCRPGEEILPVSLAPNPASQQFILQNLPASDIQVLIFDINGRLVKNYQNSHGNSFDISDVNTGIYIVKAMQAGISLYNGKLVVIN